MAALAPPEACPERAHRAERFELLKARLSAKPTLPVEGLVPTAIPELDRLLHGGFPAGIVATRGGPGGAAGRPPGSHPPPELGRRPRRRRHLSAGAGRGGRLPRASPDRSR